MLFIFIYFLHPLLSLSVGDKISKITPSPDEPKKFVSLKRTDNKDGPDWNWGENIRAETSEKNEK